MLKRYISAILITFSFHASAQDEPVDGGPRALTLEEEIRRNEALFWEEQHQWQAGLVQREAAAAATQSPDDDMYIERMRVENGLVQQCRKIVEEPIRNCLNAIRRREKELDTLFGEDFAVGNKPKGMFKSFSEGEKKYEIAIEILEKLRSECDPRINPSRKHSNQTVCDCSEQAQQITTPEIERIFDAAKAVCRNTFAAAQRTIKDHMTEAANTRNDYQRAAKRVMLIGGAAAGTALLANELDSKKDRKRDKRRAAEEKYNLDNGIIVTSDGNKLQCLTPEHYQKQECREMLFYHCQGESSNGVGCTTFNNFYCSGEGSNSNYCLFTEAKKYCAQSGAYINQSPACIWANGRSSACLKEPEHLSCLYPASADGLTLSCAKFPNDPLCQAHKNGRIVVAGGQSFSGDGSSSSSSMSMDDLIAGNSQTNNQGNSSSDTLPSSSNLWGMVSSAVQEACTAGQLVDCQ